MGEGCRCLCGRRGICEIDEELAILFQQLGQKKDGLIACWNKLT